VLIPQALAYAALAGMPPESGLYVAALAPIAAAFGASSPYLGTGPTAITSLLTFGALAVIASPGSDNYIALAALLAVMVGVIRVILGLARAGFIAYLMSQPAILGFTTGAAVVIVASQMPAVLGVSTQETNPFYAAFAALSRPGAWELMTIVVAVGTGAIMLLGRRIHRVFPGILVAVVAWTIFAALFEYPGAILGSIDAGLPPFTWDLPWGSALRLLAPAAVIAIIGFSEPASIARRYATMDRQRWSPDRELISQGLANLAAGLGGGFPAGGSFSRSALVRASGARTRLAGGITGLTVLLLLPFMGVLETLPVAVLGASIIVAVVELLRVTPFLEYRRWARLQFLVAIGTFAATLAFAPHVERAVLVGVVLAIGAHLWRELRLSVPAWTTGSTLHLAPKGVLYFASAPALEDAFSGLLSQHRSADKLIVHLDGLGRVDLTGALALRNLLCDARNAGLAVDVADIPPQANKIVSRVLEGVPGSGRCDP
jgi:SulP family sulfate permease